jgi:hypothetical protein
VNEWVKKNEFLKEFQTKWDELDEVKGQKVKKKRRKKGGELKKSSRQRDTEII